MKVLSGMLFLLLLLMSSSMVRAGNTIVLGEDGQITEEQTETAAETDQKGKEVKKDKKGKKGKKGDSEEEPDCE